MEFQEGMKRCNLGAVIAAAYGLSLSRVIESPTDFALKRLQKADKASVAVVSMELACRHRGHTVSPRRPMAQPTVLMVS